MAYGINKVQRLFRGFIANTLKAELGFKSVQLTENKISVSFNNGNALVVMLQDRDSLLFPHRIEAITYVGLNQPNGWSNNYLFGFTNDSEYVRSELEAIRSELHRSP